MQVEVNLGRLSSGSVQRALQSGHIQGWFSSSEPSFTFTSFSVVSLNTACLAVITELRHLPGSTVSPGLENYTGGSHGPDQSLGVSYYYIYYHQVIRRT